jgi:hypothetical protein
MTDIDRLEAEIRHLREMMDLRFDAISKALELQAREYERRLGVLNHENERIVQIQAQGVSNEKFDGHVKAYEEWKRNVDGVLSLAEGAKVGTEKDRARLRQLVVISIGAATLIISAVVALANGLVG